MRGHSRLGGVELNSKSRPFLCLDLGKACQWIRSHRPKPAQQASQAGKACSISIRARTGGHDHPAPPSSPMLRKPFPKRTNTWVIQLKRFLLSSPITVLLIIHDRIFLFLICNKTTYGIVCELDAALPGVNTHRLCLLQGGGTLPVSHGV
jgi:hypothetical protein